MLEGDSDFLRFNGVMSWLLLVFPGKAYTTLTHLNLQRYRTWYSQGERRTLTGREDEILFYDYDVTLFYNVNLF